MKRRSLFAGACVAAFAGAAACSAFGTHEAETPAAGSDSGAGQDVRAIDDAGSTDGASVDPCPIGVGPAMTVVTLPQRRLCVDRTEVTSAQFAAFRAAITDTAPLSARVPAGCADVSAGGLTAADDNGELPRMNVSFCSAAYFCAAQGKRLCGSLADGGPVIVADDTPEPALEWEVACANGNATNFYPWGTTDPKGVVTSKCLTNDGYPDATAPRPVGAEPLCAPNGGSGPFDMIGNVWEYVNGRHDHDGGASFSMVRGSAYNGPVAGNGCGSPHAISAGNGSYASGAPAVGFRCCADPM